MTFLKVTLAVACITVLAGHVAPSIDDNNRYLKVTPLRDGVRLAYTVFFGEIPGASERRAIDANGDGRIDDGEAKRFADKLGAEVAAAIDLDLDGTPQRVQWQLVSPGMGSDAVAAGSFSIDLITVLCMRAGPGKHTLKLRDQFRIPRPGETEVKVEDSPGVTIERARVGPADDASRNFRFAGPGGPLADDGLDLAFTSTANTPAVGKCATAAPPAQPSSTRWLVIGAAVIAALGIAYAIYRLRARAS